MMVEFERSDLGMIHYFFGIEVVHTVNGIFICRKKYIWEFWTCFKGKLQPYKHFKRVWLEAKQRLWRKENKMQALQASYGKFDVFKNKSTRYNAFFKSNQQIYAESYKDASISCQIIFCYLKETKEFGLNVRYFRVYW